MFQLIIIIVRIWTRDEATEYDASSEGERMCVRERGGERRTVTEKAENDSLLICCGRPVLGDEKQTSIGASAWRNPFHIRIRNIIWIIFSLFTQFKWTRCRRFGCLYNVTMCRWLNVFACVRWHTCTWSFCDSWHSLSSIMARVVGRQINHQFYLLRHPAPASAIYWHAIQLNFSFQPINVGRVLSDFQQQQQQQKSNTVDCCWFQISIEFPFVEIDRARTMSVHPFWNFSVESRICVVKVNAHIYTAHSWVGSIQSKIMMNQFSSTYSSGNFNGKKAKSFPCGH